MAASPTIESGQWGLSSSVKVGLRITAHLSWTSAKLRPPPFQPAKTSKIQPPSSSQRNSHTFKMCAGDPPVPDHPHCPGTCIFGQTIGHKARQPPVRMARLARLTFCLFVFLWLFISFFYFLFVTEMRQGAVLWLACSAAPALFSDGCSLSDFVGLGSICWKR